MILLAIKQYLTFDSGYTEDAVRNCVATDLKSAMKAIPVAINEENAEERIAAVRIEILSALRLTREEFDALIDMPANEYDIWNIHFYEPRK